VNDQRLLRNFVEQGSQQAFAELSQRHMGLVFSTCHRELEDNDLAQDATQAVFLLMAQKAKALCRHPHVTGWLFHTSRFVAKNVRKTELLRRKQEEAMIEQITKSDYPHEPEWNAIDPLLNNALAALKTLDRDAILLRYFEGRTLADVGAILGVSEDGARKRIERALDKMRVYFQRHDIAISISALSLLFAAHAAKAVPASCAAALPYASPKIAQIAQGALKSMTFTQIKTTVIVGAASLIIGGTVQHIAAAQSSQPSVQASPHVQTISQEPAPTQAPLPDPGALAILNKVRRAYMAAKTLTADTQTGFIRHDATNISFASDIHFGKVRVMLPNFAESEDYWDTLTFRNGSDGARRWSEAIGKNYYEDNTNDSRSKADQSHVNTDGSNVFAVTADIDAKGAYFNIYTWLKAYTNDETYLNTVKYAGKEDVDGVSCDVIAWQRYMMLPWQNKTGQSVTAKVYNMYKLYIGKDNFIHEFSVSNQYTDEDWDKSPEVEFFQKFTNIQACAPLEPASFAYVKPTVPLENPAGLFYKPGELPDNFGGS
jgi:RNA polymerase sigma factor (sigma-70 family)